MEEDKYENNNPFDASLEERNEPEEDSKLSMNKSATSKIYKKLQESEQLTNKFFYYITLIYFAQEDFTMSICLITLPSMISVYGRVYDLDVPGMNIFNLYFLALYTAGNILGGLFNYKLGVFGNTSYSRFFVRIIFTSCFFLALIHNKNLFLGLRFVQGFCIGILVPCSLGDLFRLSPPNMKAIAGSVISFSFATGMTLGMLLIYFESLGWYSWKVIYIIFGSVQVFALLVNLLIHRIDLSFEQSVQKGDKDTARKILSRYLKSECVEFMIEEEEKFSAISQRPGTTKSLLLAHYREFIMVAVVYVGLTTNFSNIYGSYMMLFVCRDLEDPIEIRQSTMFLTIACGVEFFAKLAPLVFPSLTDKRKQTLVRGSSIIVILWAAMSFYYYVGNWFAQKIIAIAWMAVLGFFIFPAFFCMASDLVTGELLSVVFSLGRVLEIGIQTFFSLVFPKQKAEALYWKASLIFAVLSLVLVIIYKLYLFETRNLTKTQIHNILIGKKRRPAE